MKRKKNTLSGEAKISTKEADLTRETDKWAL
jgi:hypothetical protein